MNQSYWAATPPTRCPNPACSPKTRLTLATFHRPELPSTASEGFTAAGVRGCRWRMPGCWQQASDSATVSPSRRGGRETWFRIGAQAVAGRTPPRTVDRGGHTTGQARPPLSPRLQARQFRPTGRTRCAPVHRITPASRGQDRSGRNRAELTSAHLPGTVVGRRRRRLVVWGRSTRPRWLRRRSVAIEDFVPPEIPADVFLTISSPLTQEPPARFGGSRWSILP
jgi:hypothetical protein